jgi:hypothetical protein
MHLRDERVGAANREDQAGSLRDLLEGEASTIARRLDRLNVMDTAPIPIRAEPAAIRCGEMVE